MANLSLEKFIPAGCIQLQKQSSPISDDQWPSEHDGRWQTFVHPADVSAEFDPILGRHAHLLPTELQELLLHSVTLEPFSRLFHKRWIQLQFGISQNELDCGILRVYILPHDVDRRSVPRSDGKLRKDMQTLLACLDHSKELWHGVRRPSCAPNLARLSRETTDRADGEDTSLLQMFNTIPSPNPQPDVIRDVEYRRAMNALLTSKMDGLKTQLYGYQSRSAAVMLQREVSPGQVVDPRLVHALDQQGISWYYDDVTGTVLREARRYDAVSGGILAEEMGTGKTLICLALILATKSFPAEAPDIYRGNCTPKRPRVASLADMAAAVVTRESVPWRLYLPDDYTGCLAAIKRNTGCYFLSSHESRRESRQPQAEIPPVRILISNCSLVLVPTNLVKQWEQEIHKHTSDLKVLVVSGQRRMPTTDELLTHDMVLMSTTRFEKLKNDRVPTRTGWALESSLAQVHFKRVIVDEGHRLGNSKIGKKSDLLLVLECLQVSARWIVTGTPSTGLFGVDSSAPVSPTSETSTVDESAASPPSKKLAESSGAQERKDLERIGAMASLYLKARPWANTLLDNSDTTADWPVYVMQPKHSSRSSGRMDCLRATLDSLIIRHQRAEIGDLLPPVVEKVVFLDGSYQDKLCLNLFSMMIIFNAVQSERKDQDYFFHPSQRRAMLELVHNIRQASFFGGYFYTASELDRSIETAEKFLEEKKVPISREDETLLREALEFGRVARRNHLKDLGDKFHEVPFYVQDFPGGGDFAKAWSLDEKVGELICTDAPMVLALQKFLGPCVDAPHSLQLMFNDGRFVQNGRERRLKGLADRASASQASTLAGGGSRSTTLAGNTKLGGDDASSPIRLRSGSLGTPARMENVPAPYEVPETEIAEPLARAKIVSTASAKLSYLIDSIVRYQDEEQIIVFYENENVVFYLAEHLEILQIHHLIYAKSITAERRAQYVDTFNHNPKFRVLLMDISQAAFGLDMRSASRIYFINPVLNPQVEAQAIGRVRRISQRKQVSVETLVLRGSIEEVIMQRRQRMTQAEHRRCKSILDDRPIYEWILNARILPLPAAADDDGPAQMAPLRTPQFLFGRGFGRVEHPDEGLVVMTHGSTDAAKAAPSREVASSAAATTAAATAQGTKRSHGGGPGGAGAPDGAPSRTDQDQKRKRPKVAIVRFREPGSTTSEDPPAPLE